MAERDPRFQDIREGLESLVSSLNRGEDGTGERPEQLQNLETALRTELSHWRVDVEIEIIPPVVEKIFELGTNLHLDDGVKTLAEQKGHGLQRAVIFALIRAWAQALRATPPAEAGRPFPRASSESVIFAMEEPEIYLHPHAQRRLAVAIQQISDSPDHQVFLCSHSTHFVDLDQYKNICIITKPNPREGTQVRQCTMEIFGGAEPADRKRRFHMARWVNPDRGEMFFAKRVAFVEGETEKTALPYIAEKCSLFDPEVSVIDCGSKHNLPLYIAIANHFQIPYIVIHDEDPVPDPVPADWDADKIREKKRTFGLNQEIQNMVNPQLGRVEIFSKEFEEAVGVSKTQGEKKGKALAALDHFQDKSPEEIPQRLKEVVQAIYGP
jgi:putative ATP-dependent endonuclease of the OLD family